MKMFYSYRPMPPETWAHRPAQTYGPETGWFIPSSQAPAWASLLAFRIPGQHSGRHTENGVGFCSSTDHSLTDQPNTRPRRVPAARQVPQPVLHSGGASPQQLSPAAAMRGRGRRPLPSADSRRGPWKRVNGRHWVCSRRCCPDP